jgi:hypothetical protein
MAGRQAYVKPHTERSWRAFRTPASAVRRRAGQMASMLGLFRPANILSTCLSLQTTNIGPGLVFGGKVTHDAYGVYHFTNSREYSPLEWAREILRLASSLGKLVKPYSK